MKKKILAFILAAASCVTLTACNDSTTSSGSGNSGAGNSGNSSSSNNSSSSSSGSSSDKVISLRVWGPEEDQKLLSEMVEKFKAQYSDRTFNIEIGVESESTAKDTILTDVSAAADVFAFASDQLNDLVAGNALANLNEFDAAFKAICGKSLDDVKAQNSAGSAAAATKDGKMYAMPLGAGNNYYMYYDKSVITEEDTASWDTLLDAASKAGRKVGMVMNSGWYLGGFFLGAGFDVHTNPDGTTAMEWNGTSKDGYTGVQVTEGILSITGNPAFMAVNDGDTGNQIAAGDLCAIVSGSWDMTACENRWGEGSVGACKLPTFTVAGKQVQQGCFSGFKLMGVNAMSKEIGWAAVLAEFLTNEESQVMRFNSRQLAPTNNKAADSDAVKADIGVAASVAQDNACGVLQDVSGQFWDPSKTFGEILAQNQLKIGDTAGIQTALDNYVAGATAPVA